MIHSSLRGTFWDVVQGMKFGLDQIEIGDRVKWRENKEASMKTEMRVRDVDGDTQTLTHGW